MTKPLEIDRLTGQLKAVLIRRGPTSAQEARQELRISQPSFSRLISQMGSDVLAIGVARRTRYALRRQIPQVGERTPLYVISEKGTATHLANLHAIEQKGFYLESNSPELSSDVYPDLPYFLE